MDTRQREVQNEANIPQIDPIAHAPQSQTRDPLLNLLNLPNELLERIAEATSRGRNAELDFVDTKSLRLTCRTLAAIGLQTLFETAILRTDLASYQRFHALQRAPYLCSKVRHLIFIIGELSESAVAYGLAWRNAIRNLQVFRNLTSVYLKCSTRRIMDWYTGETGGFDTAISFLCSFLNHEKKVLHNYGALTMGSMPYLNAMAIANSAAFPYMLSTLKELHLDFRTLEQRDRPKNNVADRDLYRFYRELSNLWLKSCSQNLTRLTLYADIFWGWAPAFDPRGLHFTKLEYLALGKFTFAHHWQSDWIILHGPTLQTLILDDCPILFYIRPFNCLKGRLSIVSHDDHTKFLARDELEGNDLIHYGPADNNHWSYEYRWHHLFPKLESGLPILTKFVSARSPSDIDCFEKRNLLKPKLEHTRYISFNGGRPIPWRAFKGGDDTYEGFVSYNFDEVLLKTPAVAEPPFSLLSTPSDYERDSYGECGSENLDEEGPGCQAEDEAAFHQICNTVARRASRQIFQL